MSPIDLHRLAQRGFGRGRLTRLAAALTHRSYAVEAGCPDLAENQRLEFLGDAVLGAVAAEWLVAQCRDWREGPLTKVRSRLTNAATLARVARKLELGKYLWLGRGEEQGGGREKNALLADALEAIIGAVYLDAGYECAERLVHRLFEGVELSPRLQEAAKDAKTALQEWLQGRKMNLPQYRVVSTTGAAHNQVFHVECEVVELQRVERGSGASRRAAEQAAAGAMLAQLKAKNV